MRWSEQLRGCVTWRLNWQAVISFSRYPKLCDNYREQTPLTVVFFAIDFLMYSNIMGGGASSTSKTEVLSETVAEVMMKNLVDCGSSSTTTQRFEVSGDGNTIAGVKMLQAFTITVDCANSATNVTKLQSAVTSAIKNSSTAQSVALVGALGSSSSNVDQLISTSVRNSITSENITKLSLESNTAQVFLVSGSNNTISDITMEQRKSVILKAVMKVVNDIDVIQKISNAAVSDSAAIQKGPLDFLTDWMDGLTGVIIVMILAGAFVAVQFIPGMPSIGRFLDDKADE